MTREDSGVERIDGRGRSNGVNYSFDLERKSWFGSYECHISRTLLDTQSKKISTKNFKIGEHTWSLTFYHTPDGWLAGYICSKSQKAVTIHFSFAVLNKANGTEHIVKASTRELTRGHSWGFHKLIPISKLSDPLAGYLCEDEFSIKLEMRIKLPENEWHSLTADDDDSGTFVWRLRNLKGLSPNILFSEPFVIGDLKWQMQFRLSGDQGDNHASAFLFSCNDSSAVVSYIFEAVNHKSVRSNISEENRYTFTNNHKGHGWSNFIPEEALEDGKSGFLNDGWFTLIVTIFIDHKATKATDSKQAKLLAMQEDEEAMCIYCLEKPQTSGVLHGSTTHKCYCLDCARMFKEHKNLCCPLCRLKVDKIIERFY